MRPDLVFRSWLRTRRAMSATPAQLSLLRAGHWARLQPALARTPALTAYQGRPLAEYPVTDPAQMRGDYGAWNSLGYSAQDLRALADQGETGEQIGDVSAGWSTGSGGGTRGLFVATGAERADYVGQSLARLLPARALLNRHRLALHLRATNALYSDVRRHRLAFAHFPLEPEMAATMGHLETFNPTILIAPPHRLLGFARAGLRLPSLRHLMCGSEPISPAERAFITQEFDQPLRVIYQATEGFLAAECASGSLHLNEHAIHFEFEPVPGTSGFRLLVTDLRRTSQPIIRLRMDDYIERSETACRCGYAGRVIHPPQGRVRDIWRLADRTITPPQVVDSVEAELGGAQDWLATAQRGMITLRTCPIASETMIKRAAKRLQQLTGQHVRHQPDLPAQQGAKRRKVVWHDG